MSKRQYYHKVSRVGRYRSIEVFNISNTTITSTSIDCNYYCNDHANDYDCKWLNDNNNNNDNSIHDNNNDNSNNQSNNNNNYNYINKNNTSIPFPLMNDMCASHSVMASSNLSMPCSASSFKMHPVTPSRLTLSKYITLEERNRVQGQQEERNGDRDIR